MEAKLKFDLNKEDDMQYYIQCVHANKMAGFIWELQNNFWRKWKHTEEEFTLDNYKEALADLLAEYRINPDELYY